MSPFYHSLMNQMCKDRIRRLLNLIMICLFFYFLVAHSRPHNHLIPSVFSSMPSNREHISFQGSQWFELGNVGTIWQCTMWKVMLMVIKTVGTHWMFQQQVIQALRLVCVFSMSDLITVRFSAEGRNLLIRATHSFVLLTCPSSQQSLVTSHFLLRLWPCSRFRLCSLASRNPQCDTGL